MAEERKKYAAPEAQKLVAGYIRVSTEEQSRNGLSLESQQADIEDYCRRMRYRLVRLYIDRGISARKSLYKRTAFMEMMEDVKAKKVNHIVVLRLDRFFRNVYDYHRMMHEYLDPAGCGWSAVKEEYDTTTTNGRLMINLRLSIAEQECDQDSDRIRDVFANRIRQGYIVSGSPPFGYRIAEDKRLVPDEETKETVRDIFRVFLEVNSVRKVLMWFRDNRDIVLYYDRVRHVLGNEIYTGVYRDNKNFCEPLIDRDMFDAAQRALRMNVRDRSGKRTYVFSGILRCSLCGSAMSGTSPACKEYKYYRCHGAYQSMVCGNRNNVNERTVEQYLQDNLDHIMKEYEVDEERLAAIALEKKKNALERLRAKIGKINDLYINGLMKLDEAKRRTKEVEAEIAAEEAAEATREKPRLSEYLSKGWQNLYEYMTDEERQALWRLLIKEIRCSRGKVDEVVFLGSMTDPRHFPAPARVPFRIVAESPSTAEPYEPYEEPDEEPPKPAPEEP